MQEVFEKIFVVSGLKASFQFIKKSVLSINRILSLGTALILLLVITLFIGVFAALSDNSTVGSTYEPLSPEVIAYQETIEKYAKQYDMEDYVPIISAVMMQESGGKGNDPMQASECPYNTKYPKKPNGIEEPEYSIEVGIHYLSDCFNKQESKIFLIMIIYHWLYKATIMEMDIFNGRSLTLVAIPKQTQKYSLIKKS